MNPSAGAIEGQGLSFGRRPRRPARRRLALLLLAPLAALCAAEASSPTPRFDEVAREAGIRHRHGKPVLDAKLDNVMPWVSSVGAAAAAADYDRDGRVDLFVTNSAKGAPNFLYRNLGDGTFAEVARQAGVADWNDEGGVAMAAVWGDVDNDGWPDLFIVRWGRDLLLANRGDGTFEEVTARRFRRADGPPGTDWKNGNAAVFFDYDLDGRLDLYVGNYFADFDLWHLATTRIMHDDFEKARNAGTNQLFHQEADGSFRELAAAAGVDDVGWTLAVAAGDLDNDGWPDLYSANDFGPDQLFVNRRDGSFANLSARALGIDTRKGMNVDFGDVNGDGWLDVYVTNITTEDYLQEGNMLWLNDGAGADGELTFTDVAAETGTYDGGWGWGAKFFDADNDGDLDLFAANGFISAGPENYWYDLASFTIQDRDPAEAANWPPIGDRTFSGYEAKRFWLNEDGATFTERAAEAGLASDRDGRGVVVFDYEDDGDLDLFLANQGQEPQLFRNRGTPGHHWLSVLLSADPATGTNRDAVGARVWVETPAGRQLRERDGGNGYAGQSDPRLFFGLGEHATVERLTVRWPDGGVQEMTAVAADRLLEIRQDPARYLRREPAAPAGRTPVAAAGAGSPAAGQTAAEVAEALAAFEQRLGSRPPGWALASAYRALAAEHRRQERAIAFFEELVARHPEDLRLRAELGAAYVDKIPLCGGVAAVICKGKLARRSLEQYEALVAADPDSWVGHYGLGINHLHWPRGMRHSDDSAAALERCVALQARSGRRPPPAHHLRVHVALGDAYGKDGQFARARAAWRRGLAEFPGASVLEERLAIADDRALLGFILGVRNLERPIDTDFTFLDGAP
jgi:tetratricopeptide (TPR) repeat protein